MNAPQGISFLKVYDPQNVLVTKKVNTTKLSSKVNKDKKGHHTFFVYTRQGNMEWWQPVNVYVNVPQVVYNGFENIETGKCRVVNMDKQFNSSVADIFKNEYLSPRSPYTTLQLPTQGIGEWCHPLLTAEIDDSGLRSLVKDNMYKTSLGIPFRVMKEGNNIAYTSLWDNYPDMVKVPLSGKASHAYLLLVGSTNHMQCRIANGIVRVYYTDGTSEVLELVNPDNWCPIEQDFYLDDFAFDAPRPRPYRFHLKTGIVSRDLGKALKLRGSADRRFEGGAGVMLDIPLDKNKTLKELTLETVANDVVIGLMSVMLRRIIAFWGDLSLCSRPHFAALRLLYLTLQATVQVAYLIINIIELQFSPCTFLLPIREIFIPFPGFSRYDVPFTNHFLSSFHCFFVGFPCFPLRKCIAIPLFHYATFCFRMSDLLNTSVSGDSSKTVRLVIIVCT